MATPYKYVIILYVVKKYNKSISLLYHNLISNRIRSSIKKDIPIFMKLCGNVERLSGTNFIPDRWSCHSKSVWESKLSRIKSTLLEMFCLENHQQMWLGTSYFTLLPRFIKI